MCVYVDVCFPEFAILSAAINEGRTRQEQLEDALMGFHLSAVWPHRNLVDWLCLYAIGNEFV